MTRFVWHDLMATDPARAAGFYTEVLGLHVRTVDGGAVPIRVVERGGQPIATILPFPANAGVPSHWVPYAAVDDLTGFCAHVAACGGTVCIQPSPHPLGGRFAFFTDPERGFFSAIEGGPRDPGGFGLDELLAGDVDAAGAFYAKLFGWTAAPADRVTWFARGGEHAAWMIAKPPIAPSPMWLPHVIVDDVREVARRAGPAVMVPPKTVPGAGTYCVMADPAGATVCAVQRAA